MQKSKKSSSIRWMMSGYLVMNRIESFNELAKMTGIKYKTLLEHMAAPENFRMYEITALDRVLQFKDEDLLILVRGVSA